jgi:hypothetical protein
MRTSSLPQKRDIGPHPKLMAREPTTPSPSRERAGVRGWLKMVEQPLLSFTIFQQESQRLFKKMGYTTYESRRGS